MHFTRISIKLAVAGPVRDKVNYNDTLCVQLS